MSNIITIAVFCVFPAVFALICEILISVMYKKYIGYIHMRNCTHPTKWFYSSWNYIGGRPIMRHVGVRWFGFEFEKTYEIPMGELRF